MSPFHQVSPKLVFKGKKKEPKFVLFSISTVNNSILHSIFTGRRFQLKFMPHLLTGHHLSFIVQPGKPSRGIATTGRIMHWPGKKSKKKTWWGQGWGDRRQVGSVAWPCRVPAGLQQFLTNRLEGAVVSWLRGWALWRGHRIYSRGLIAVSLFPFVLILFPSVLILFT